MSHHRVTVSGLLYGQTHQNVLHVSNPDGALSHSQIADEFETHWISQVKTKQVTSMIYNQIIVSDSSGSGPPAFTKAVNVAGTNVANADAVPFSCFVVQLRTNLAGRHGHGRFYVSGVTNSAHTNGIVTAAVITAWNTTLATMKARFAEGGTSALTLVLKEKNAQVYHPVTDMIIRQYLGVQRRRNYGVGI